MQRAHDALRRIHQPTNRDAHPQHPRARAAQVPVRAGVAFGPVLAQDGDYFGPPVNLAARLVSLAEPGGVLVDDGLAAELDRAAWSVEPREPRPIRGFPDRLATYAIRTREQPH